jgi:hypothetical protein
METTPIEYYSELYRCVGLLHHRHQVVTSITPATKALEITVVASMFDTPTHVVQDLYDNLS